VGHFLRAALVGLLAGLVAVAFQWSLAFADAARNGLLSHLHQLPSAQYWGWAVLPLIGLIAGCLVGYIVTRYAPEAPGSGIPHVKAVLLQARSMSWKRLLPVKFFGGILSVGSGLSLGREGPTVQMGASLGKFVADALRLPPRLVPQLVSCGAGAGLAAAFNAPMAGFLFVLEELHRELSALTFGGALIAALVADIVARSLTGQLPSFSVKGYPALPLWALPLAAIVGIAGGLIGASFNKAILACQEFAISIGRRNVIPRWVHPGLIAALCGLVAWWCPIAVGGGHAIADALLSQHIQLTLLALAGFFVLKYLLSCISYATGAPGGVFAPMLLLGAVLGLISGHFAASLFPSLAPLSPAFAVLGMAAVFTGSVRAPLTGIVLILEMTANYDQLLALAVTALVANLTADLTRDTPLYEALLEADLSRNRSATTLPTAAHAEQPPTSIVLSIQPQSELDATTLRTAGLPPGCLVTSVERAGRELLPRPDLKLHPGDHLTLLLPYNDTQSALRLVEMATVSHAKE
jgi:CIC family chloride channel protein